MGDYQQDEENHFWIFGYGSLMWRPGFDYLEACKATITGLHRAPCIYSWVHRGTQERPGIVLGLDRGGTCTGMAFKVSNTIQKETVAYLQERELVTNVYLESHDRAVLETGGEISCLTYIVDQNHEQYAGQLPIDELMHQIRGAIGQSGRNEDYFINTAQKLKELDIRDELMESIVKHLTD